MHDVAAPDWLVASSDDKPASVKEVLRDHPIMTYGWRGGEEVLQNLINSYHGGRGRCRILRVIVIR